MEMKKNQQKLHGTIRMIPQTYIFLKFIFIYLFILPVPGLCCGMQNLHCGMQGLLFCVCVCVACRLLSCGMHVESSSPTRDRTQAPCIGSRESYPLDCQGSPPTNILSRGSQTRRTQTVGCSRQSARTAPQTYTRGNQDSVTLAGQ